MNNNMCNALPSSFADGQAAAKQVISCKYIGNKKQNKNFDVREMRP